MAGTKTTTEEEIDEQPLSQANLKKRQQQMLDDVDEVTQTLHQMSQQEKETQTLLQAYQNVPEEEVELMRKLQAAQEGVQKAIASQMSLRRDLDKVKEDLAPLVKRRDSLDSNIASRTVFKGELEELNEQIRKLEFRHKEYEGYLKNWDRRANGFRDEIPKLQDELFEREERRLRAALEDGPTHPIQQTHPQTDVSEENDPGIRSPQQIIDDVAELEKEMNELVKDVDDLAEQSRSVGTQLQEQQDAQRKELAGPPVPQKVFTAQEQAEATVLQKLSDTQRKLQETRLAEMNQRRELAKLREQEKELTQQWKDIPSASVKQASKADYEKNLEEVRNQQEKCENELGELGKQVMRQQKQIDRLQDEFSELDQGVPLQQLASYQEQMKSGGPEPEVQDAGLSNTPEVTSPTTTEHPGPTKVSAPGEHHSVRDMLAHEHAGSWVDQLKLKLRQAAEQLRQFFQKSPDSPSPKAEDLEKLEGLRDKLEKGREVLEKEQSQHQGNGAHVEVSDSYEELMQGLEDVGKNVKMQQDQGLGIKGGTEKHVSTGTAAHLNAHHELHPSGHGVKVH